MLPHTQETQVILIYFLSQERYDFSEKFREVLRLYNSQDNLLLNLNEI